VSVRAHVTGCFQRLRRDDSASLR